MLQTFRERIQGWVVTLIVTLIVLGLGLFGLQNYWSGRSAEVVATVNGHKIYESQLNHAYEQVRRQAMESKLNLNDAMQTLLKKEVLQSLIRKQIELRTAMNAGFKISPEQVEAAVYAMPFLQENGKFSYPKLQQFLAFSGYSEAGFLSEIEQLALIDQLKSGVVLSAFALEDEVEEAVTLEKQTRTFDYVVIPHSTFAAKSMPQPEAIQAYYAQNESTFKTPEKIKVDYLALIPEEVKKEIVVSDTEIKNYYEDNKAVYQGKTLEEVKDQIRQILLSEKLQTTLSTLSDQLAELTYTHSDNLDAAGKGLKLSVKTSDFFPKKGGTGFFADPAVIQAAFNPEVLAQGRNSDVIRLNDGTLLVLRVKQHEPEKVLPLDSVKDQIIAKLKLQMSKVQTNQFGEEWLKMLKEDKDIASAMKSQKLAWKSVTTKGVKAEGVDENVLKTVFEVSPERSEKPKIIGKSLPNGDYVLIRLKSVELGDLNTLTTEEHTAFQKKLEQMFGQLDYGFYVDSIIKKSKITVN